MRSLLLSVSLLLCLVAPAVAQLHPWVPVGTEWWYEIEAVQGYSHHLYMRAERDTVLPTQDTAAVVVMYTVQRLISGGIDTSETKRWLFATDSVRVYYRGSGGEWHQWLDFSLSAGDTNFIEGLEIWDSTNQPPCGSHINGADTLSINGVSVPRLFIGFPLDPVEVGNCDGVYSLYEYQAVQYVGPLIFFPVYNGLLFLQNGGGLRCYRHPVLGEYSPFGRYAACDTLTPAVGQAPSAAAGQVRAWEWGGRLYASVPDGSRASATVSTFDGRQIETYALQPGENEFEHDLPPGVYLLAVSRPGWLVQHIRFAVF